MYGCMFIVRPNGKKLCIGSSGLKITKPLTLTFFFPAKFKKYLCIYFWPCWVFVTVQTSL